MFSATKVRLDPTKPDPAVVTMDADGFQGDVDERRVRFESDGWRRRSEKELNKHIGEITFHLEKTHREVMELLKLVPGLLVQLHGAQKQLGKLHRREDVRKQSREDHIRAEKRHRRSNAKTARKVAAERERDLYSASDLSDDTTKDEPQQKKAVQPPSEKEFSREQQDRLDVWVAGGGPNFPEWCYQCAYGFPALQMLKAHGLQVPSVPPPPGVLPPTEESKISVPAPRHQPSIEKNQLRRALTENGIEDIRSASPASVSGSDESDTSITSGVASLVVKG